MQRLSEYVAFGERRRTRLVAVLERRRKPTREEDGGLTDGETAARDENGGCDHSPGTGKAVVRIRWRWRAEDAGLRVFYD